MRKLQITLMIVLSSSFLTIGASAQNKPLACQTDAVGGLEWESGRWVTSTYVPRRFILVQTKDGLSKDSAGKALVNDFLQSISCIKDGRITCFDTLGGYLFFDPQTLKGGIAQVFGSISNGTKKDSVGVQVFSCTPF
jgi:hypothetical protein